MSLVAMALALVGVVFLVAGTVGVLRLPDTYTRLHAVTKVDNVGLGFIAAAMALEAGSVPEALKVVAAWLLVIVSAAVTSHLIARDAHARGVAPWRRR